MLAGRANPGKAKKHLKKTLNLTGYLRVIFALAMATFFVEFSRMALSIHISGFRCVDGVFGDCLEDKFVTENYLTVFYLLRCHLLTISSSQAQKNSAYTYFYQCGLIKTSITVLRHFFK